MSYRSVREPVAGVSILPTLLFYSYNLILVSVVYLVAYAESVLSHFSS